jgi:1,5-anhydro-D-fructose reductase (1,5-anhydro-D-mannitol-forming)
LNDKISVYLPLLLKRSGNMKPIQGSVCWGIIGCGDVCEVKSGPAFNKVEHSKLVAVMRRDAVKAEDYARRHGVPKFYSDASQLINDTEVNAIYIATPPSTHESYTLEAMKSGKPVYVEKPVTINAESCQRMIGYAKQYDISCSVAHYRRGLPLFKKVKSLVTEGAIGNVRVIRLSTLQPEKSKLINQTADNWRVIPELSGGGLFHDLSPHQLDIMYWIFGAPREVSGRSLNQSKKYNAPDVTMLDAVYDSDIYLNGLWAFNVEEAVAQDYCEIVGDKGMLRFAFFRKSNLEMTTSAGMEVMEFDYPVNIQEPMIASVTKYFRGEGDNPCSLEEALVIMKMIDETM